MTAEDFLQLLLSSRVDKKNLPPLIDVRSEGEFDEGSIPGFQNVPVLNNEERHLVGTCYKKQGKDEAIQLGYSLVVNNREEKTKKWITLCENSSLPPILACWRGGLRSKISCEWLTEKGLSPIQLNGGYKAVRKILFSETHLNSHDYLILSGKTGCGKTRLLRDLPESVKKIDLEMIARHRGSAFGLELNSTQPSQIDFENELGIQLLIEKGEKILLEDESRLIGCISLSEKFKAEMTVSPVVMLSETMEVRCLKIFEEYVLAPEESGFSSEIVSSHLRTQLARIRKKLGDERFQDISKTFDRAAQFSAKTADGLNAHLQWIQKVLEWYYDPMYEYALKRWDRKVIFEGDYRSCQEFLIKKYDSLKP